VTSFTAECVVAPVGTPSPWCNVATIDGFNRRPALHDGAAMVISGGTRYLASVGAPPDPISPSGGGSRWIAPDWLVITGGTLSRVVP
jgi:hypothetical protein